MPLVNGVFIPDEVLDGFDDQSYKAWTESYKTWVESEVKRYQKTIRILFLVIAFLSGAVCYAIMVSPIWEIAKPPIEASIPKVIIYEEERIGIAGDLVFKIPSWVSGEPGTYQDVGRGITEVTIGDWLVLVNRHGVVWKTLRKEEVTK